MIECRAHGRLAPGYIVCVHVLFGGAPIAHYVPADESRGDRAAALGEAICARCHETDPDGRNLGDFRLVCEGCLRPFMEHQRPN